MFSKSKNRFLGLAVSIAFASAAQVHTVDAAVASINEANLPINVSNQETAKAVSEQNKPANALVSPSRAKAVANTAVQAGSAGQNNSVSVAGNTADAKVSGNSDANAPVSPAQNNAAVSSAAKNTSAAQPAVQAPLPQQNQAQVKEDFNFDLKMKSINAPTQQNANNAAPASKTGGASINDADLPKDIQYKANPVEALGNSVLSQMDSDLFSQMSEIEKSTTLLTLELRREKIRNEIEAQKAIRQKNIDDLARQKEEQRLQDLERQKKIEAQVLQEKQALLDKEQLFEVLKQRKLLNAYMNQMLVNQQEWLKEKENLYAQISAMEEEKKELIELFKQRINKVLEASAKNIQVAEAARANFERIVKNLKARNEQLRKRVEADAQIIKNAKNSLYLKSQSIEELKDKNAANAAVLAANAAATSAISSETEEPTEEEAPEKLSSKYAILGISGRAGNMTVDVIDIDGQQLSLKVGSPLPSGHILSEIGSDYAKFSRDGSDDYLYVGRSIDGYVPTLGLTDEKSKK